MIRSAVSVVRPLPALTLETSRQIHHTPCSGRRVKKLLPVILGSSIVAISIGISAGITYSEIGAREQGALICRKAPKEENLAKRAYDLMLKCFST